MRRSPAAAFTLVEAVVALAVVGVGVVAAQRLLAHSATAVAAEHAATRAQLAAQHLLAEARLGALPMGVVGGDTDGVAFEREVRLTEHPALREVHVRTRAGAAAGASCELVEILRVPSP